MKTKGMNKTSLYSDGNHGRETTTAFVAAGMAVAKVYVVEAEVCGGAVVEVCGGGVTKVIQTRHSNGTRH
jgi:hypothetical protein